MSALTLVDINSIHIDKNQSVEKRVKSMVQQLKNPYCFKHGNIVVNVNFVGDESLENKIVELYKNS